jgi:phage shock protein E
MKKLLNLLGLLALLVAGYFFLMPRSELSGAEARRLVQAGARLVDVRTPGEFAAGHIDGAINVPLQELEHRLQELEPKQDAIVLYCRSGNRSSRAATLLRSAGYATVHDLGAMSRW